MQNKEESYIQSLFAQRLGGENFGKDTQIYKFEKIKRAKKAAKLAHPDIEILDLGVGEPDEMALVPVVEVMQKECALPENRGYADNGIPEFKIAAAKYLEKVFGVKGIEPETEVIHAIGGKPALAMFPSILINPGDVVLTTTPGYPILATQSSWLGGQVVSLPLLEKNNFLPDFDFLSKDILKKAKILYINYPNNPTGATATPEFYLKVIAFARENNLVVVQDAAYAALTYEKPPLSFLAIPGAKEVGVEIHSLSKSYNMTGWRIGFVAGNSLLVKGFGHVKDNFDSGQFIAIQKAAAYGLTHYELTDGIVRKYERRLQLLVGTLNSLGFKTRMPGGSFYLYVKIPQGVKGGNSFQSCEEFTEYLLREHLISTVPWDDAGHFVRFSATFIAPGQEAEKKVMEEIKKRLSCVEFVW